MCPPDSQEQQIIEKSQTTKHLWWILFGVVCGLLGAAMILLAANKPSGNAITLLPPPTAAPIQVHVTGAVVHPGVYSLDVESRILDAIQAAGGFSADADEHALNLAAPLEDGMRLSIPIKVKTGNLNSTTSATSTSGAREETGNEQSNTSTVNINTASQNELESLPGIGPVTAQKIIDFRNINGPFSSIEEIQEVSGIGPVTYEKIKNMITVDDQP